MNLRVFLLCTGLVVTHLLLHVGLGLGRVAPDLAVVALLLASRALGSAGGALSGFVLGLLEDAFAVGSFGANVVAMSVVGALAARTRELFVGDSIPFLAVYLALGKWGRDALAWVVSDAGSRVPFNDFVVESPLLALYAAAAGLLARLLFARGPLSR